MTTPKLLEPALAKSLASLYRTLSDPTRLRLVSALRHNECCVHDLSSLLDMEQSAVSHQLRILRDLQVVRHRKEGRHVYYALDDSHIRDLFEFGLKHVEHTIKDDHQKATSVQEQNS